MQIDDFKDDRYLNDINHHLEGLKSGLTTLQLNCNTNAHIYLLCDIALQKVCTIEKIIYTTNLHLPFKIALEVNRLFFADENLSAVYVKITNSKRLFHGDRIANLKLTV
jgi:hypothetical protein